ncbi:MAG: SH3 domain-containing protein [Hyphomicrobiales bacterium]
MQPQQPFAPQNFGPVGQNPIGQTRPSQPSQPFQPTWPQQTGSGIPRLQGQQQAGLREPPMLYEIGIALDTCRKARFAAGAPEIEICRYLAQLSNVNPSAYQRYVGQIQALRQTRDQIANQQGGTDVGSPTTSMEVASWGGVVRSGPGMDTNRIDSLKEGEVVEILQDSGVFMNGYNWFQIRYRGNKTGYQWGGIMCGRYQPVPGVHEVCN